MTNEEQAEREIINEIEIARHALEGDIEKNTREAEEKLDEIQKRKAQVRYALNMLNQYEEI